MATEICQYCGIDLEKTPPLEEVGYLYGIECSRCPPQRRRSLMLARKERVREIVCPGCGTRIAAEEDTDVLVVKEMTYEICAACGERCGVASARRLVDRSGGTM